MTNVCITLGGIMGNNFLLKPKLFSVRVLRYIKVEAARKFGYGNTQELVQEVNLVGCLITQRG